MTLYFECCINKNSLLQTVFFFFGDFAHWFGTLNRGPGLNINHMEICMKRLLTD